MASKIIQISKDDTTYRNLRGSTGDLSVEKSSSEFSLFGSEFSTSECGVMSWTLSGNSYYSGFCSYLVKIKKAIEGSGVSDTAIAMSVESGTIYRVTAASDTPWDASKALVVKDGATPLTAADIDWVDYANGRVKLSSAPDGTVTVDAHKMTLATVAFANDWSLSQSAGTVDTSSIATAQSNGGWRTYTAGIKQASLELSGFWTDANHTALYTDLTNSSVLYMEIIPSGDETDESYVRGSFKLMSDSLSGEVGSDESESASFSLYSPISVDGYITQPLAWVHPTGTSLDQGTLDVLSLWGDNAIGYMKYLPDGTNGHSGQVIVTDVSVSGGMEALTEFSMSFQGTGALGTV